MNAIPTAPITKRILSWHDRADTSQRAAGLSWYSRARDLAVDLYRKHDGRYTLAQCAAVIAVTSPSLSWGMNRKAATLYMEWHAAGLPASEWTYKLRIGLNMRKAERILNGEMSALSGRKVTAFYRNIMGETNEVTVDIWHGRAALGKDRPSKREWDAVERATRNAAKLRGITPRDMQAVVWVAIRDAQARTVIDEVS